MKTSLVVREFARLTTEQVPCPSLDRAQVTATAFDWLCSLSARFNRSGAPLVQVESRRWLRLDNYVGVVETPCGTRLEILPKHVEEGDCTARSRHLLQRMIEAAMDLPAREAGQASLQTFDVPPGEWVMGRFLEDLDRLIKRGLRSDYVRMDASEPFLRGQLDIPRQLRQPPGRAHMFQLRNDLFLHDRAENRLLKAALERVCHTTRTPAHWRLAHELNELLRELPGSLDIAGDFKCWRRDRLMAHYRPVRPWCELILYGQMPLALAGGWHGISMLFPMEKLFERYVAAAMRKALVPNAQLVTQASRHSLCEHLDSPIFQMKPDLFIQQGAHRWILDTKWKRLDAFDKAHQYNINQSDFYQLFAYGQKYLDGHGDLVLIYPMRRSLPQALPVFRFNDELRLWVLPFDLEGACLVGGELPKLPLL